MNKTYAYIGIIAIVIVGLSGVVILMIFKIDATAYITLFSTTLPIAITAALTIDGLSKVKAQTEKVKAQTAVIARNVNGNTSKLLAIAKRNILTPEEAMEIARIENENRDLISDGGADENGRYIGEHVA